MYSVPYDCSACFRKPATFASGAAIIVLSVHENPPVVLYINSTRTGDDRQSFGSHDHGKQILAVLAEPPSMLTKQLL